MTKKVLNHLIKKIEQFKVVKNIQSFIFFLGSRILYFGGTVYTFINLQLVVSKKKIKIKGGHGPSSSHQRGSVIIVK